MKKLLLLLFPLSCFAQVRNVQVNGSGNLITPSTGINFTSGQTLLASSGATLNFSAATVTLPATTAIPPPSSPTTGDLLVYSSGAWAKLSPGTSGFVLTSNGAAALPTYQAVSGSGTVTSVAATVPSFLSVAGSPVTSSGTLAVTLATQSANSVFAGPASGSAAAPTFRSLATADFPTSGVTAATYGSATQVAQIAVDATGRVTSASNVTITGGGGGIGGSSGSTDNALIRADGTGGSTVQSSNVTLADSGTTLQFSAAAGISAGGSNQLAAVSGSGTGQVQLIYNSTPELTVNKTGGGGDIPYTVIGDNSVTPLFPTVTKLLVVGVSNDATFEFSGNFGFASSGLADWNFMNRASTVGTKRLAMIQVLTGEANKDTGQITFNVKKTDSDSSPTETLRLYDNRTIKFSGYGAGTLITDSAGLITANTGYVNSRIASGSAVSLTTATAANVTSISVPAGTWFISGNINFSAASATVTGTSGGISSTSATLPTDGTEVFSGVQVTLLSETDSVTLPPKQFVLGSTTTIYLVGKSTFSAGSVSAFGSITAQQAY